MHPFKRPLIGLEMVNWAGIIGYRSAKTLIHQKICEAMKKLSTPIRPSLIVSIAALITMVLLFATTGLHAQCAVVGTGTVTGNVNFGSSNNWANPNRSTISDDLYARVHLAAGETSKYLEVSNYGWVIPPGATIVGIQVSIECHQEDLSADFADASIMLMQAGTAVGADRAGTGVYDDKDLTNVYGSPSDLWGTTWTPADVMDPGFGVLYSVTRLSGTGTYYMFVDYVELAVYYSGGGCILPVTYRAYNVVLEANQEVKIDWITTSEVNADYYAVQRSIDGKSFSEIGLVSTIGNESTENSYAFVDANAPVGTSFYRIEQVDRNGSAAFTEVKQVQKSGQAGLDITASPNPTTDYLQLRGDMTGGTAELYDLSGKLTLKTEIASDHGTLDVTTLPSGMYVLKVKTSKGTDAQRIVIR